MSDYDPKSLIIFDKEHKLEVSNTREEIRNAIAACTVPHIPLITLQDAHGEEIEINAAAIRLINSREARDPQVRVL